MIGKLGGRERRKNFRAPLQMFINQVKGTYVRRVRTANVSRTGLFVYRVQEDFSDIGEKVGLEFNLPGCEEVIWASGEVVYESDAEWVQQVGIRFDRMAYRHRRLIEEYIHETRRQMMLSSLQQTRKRRKMQGLCAA